MYVHVRNVLLHQMSSLQVDVHVTLGDFHFTSRPVIYGFSQPRELWFIDFNRVHICTCISIVFPCVCKNHAVYYVYVPFLRCRGWSFFVPAFVMIVVGIIVFFFLITGEWPVQACCTYMYIVEVTGSSTNLMCEKY